jgi:hypothetical protein
VQEEGAELNAYLTALPKHVLEDFIPWLARRFLDMITDYDERIRQLQVRFGDEETHNTVCKDMLCSILTRTTEKYDTRGINSSFAASLVIQTLGTLHHLTEFSLDTPTQVNHSALLASMIPHVPELQVFHYEFHCTDEVIKQLFHHCRKLRTLIVCDSRMVTNNSAQFIRQFRELSFVHLGGTSVDDAFYGLIITELPSISNIMITSNESHLVDHLEGRVFDTIINVEGFVRHINMLTEVCPNIRKLNIYWIIEDMINVSVLDALRSLQISRGSYVAGNMNAVLQGVGNRLTELILKNVRRVNLADIVTLCSGLESLVLERCKFQPLHADVTLDPELPHFRSLTSLKIIKNPMDPTDFFHLRHYVNLKTIECRGLEIFTDHFVSDCVHSGRFRNLECFHINEAGEEALTMQSIDLLLQHCDHLKSLGYLETWTNLNPAHINDLEEEMFNQNYDLKILL